MTTDDILQVTTRVRKAIGELNDQAMDFNPDVRMSIAVLGDQIIRLAQCVEELAQRPIAGPSLAER